MTTQMVDQQPAGTSTSWVPSAPSGHAQMSRVAADLLMLRTEADLLNLLLVSPCTGGPCIERLSVQDTSDVSLRVEGTIRAVFNLGASIGSTRDLRRFLFSNPDLISAVRAACNAGVRKWQENVRVHLVVVRDPDSADEYLAIYVRAVSYTDVFLDDLQSLAGELEALVPKQPDRLLVSTDFRLPNR